MARLFFFIFLFTSLEASAQEQPNYINYHKKIIEAEELFLDSNINGSLKRYKEIFEEYRPFAKDCFIALQLASMQGDTAKCSYFFQKSFENGIPWKTINTLRRVQALLSRYPIYNKYIYNLYVAKRNGYLAGLNYFLKAQCLTMQKKDAIYHELPAAWRARVGRNVADSLYADVLTKNVIDLVNIIKISKQFPGEKTIGIWDQDLDNYSEGSVNLRFEPITAMIFYHNGCAYAYLKKELLDAVKKGELHPRTYGLIYEWAYEDLKDESGNGGKNDLSRFYRKKCPLESKDKYYNLFIDHRLHSADSAIVNKARAELGISSLEHDKRKREFSKKYDLLLFFGQFQGAEAGII